MISTTLREPFRNNGETESFLSHAGRIPVIVIVNPKNKIISFHVMIGEILQAKPEMQEEFVRQIYCGMEHLTMVRIFRNVLNYIACEYQIIGEGASIRQSLSRRSTDSRRSPRTC